MHWSSTINTIAVIIVSITYITLTSLSHCTNATEILFFNVLLIKHENDCKSNNALNEALGLSKKREENDDMHGLSLNEP